MAVYAWCITCQDRWDACPTQIDHKESKKFRSDFRFGLPGQKVRDRRVHDNQEDAKDYERVTITDYKRGKLFPNTIGEKRTFGEACDYYRVNYLIPAKQFHDISRVEMYREFFGEKTRLAHIDKDRCKELFSKMTTYLQPSSVVRMWTLLIGIFRENAKWCANNPARGVIPKLYRKKANRPKTVYFTDDEYLQLISSCANLDEQDVVVIFRNTGFRQGDGENFLLEHCDFTTSTIHIPEQKNQEAGSIPMVPEVRKRILEIIKRKGIKSGPLLNMRNMSKRFTKICKRAGLYQPYPNNKTLHSLRHSWGTYIQKSYKDINVTQKLMRHKDIKMTMRYAHAANDMLKSAALSGSAPSIPEQPRTDVEVSQ